MKPFRTLTTSPLIRRWIALQSLIFWQGGFLFYALVVVPIGTDVLQSATEQGFITRRVTVWLNTLGLVCLFGLCWDILGTRALQRSRTYLVSIAMMLQVGLFALHAVLDRRLDPVEHIIRDDRGFYRLHAAYLILSGLLWFVMLMQSGLMLLAWRAVDQRLTKMPP